MAQAHSRARPPLRRLPRPRLGGLHPPRPNCKLPLLMHALLCILEVLSLQQQHQQHLSTRQLLQIVALDLPPPSTTATTTTTGCISCSRLPPSPSISRSLTSVRNWWPLNPKPCLPGWTSARDVSRLSTTTFIPRIRSFFRASASWLCGRRNPWAPSRPPCVMWAPST